jgi:cysteine sulfinate desulfinase/cysteine desulfurase-like protein
MDPIDAVASVAKRYGAWLHIDAAMAGSAMILPECGWMWDGAERADSVVVNAHKWLGAIRTEREHVQALWRVIRQEAERGVDGGARRERLRIFTKTPKTIANLCCNITRKAVNLTTVRIGGMTAPRRDLCERFCSSSPRVPPTTVIRCGTSAAAMPVIAEGVASMQMDNNI